jgi:hypothetical protein
MKQLFLVLSVLVFILSCKDVSEINADKQIFTINFEDAPSFYFKTIAGFNHEEISLTKTKKQPITDKKTDYIFYCSEIFYKQVSDTIIIYAPRSDISEPVEKFSEITVIINKLADYDEVKDYNINYKEYGLDKVSTLPAR